MNLIQPGLCVLLLAAGGAWSAWLASGYRPVDIAAAGLGLFVAASFAAYMATDRKDAGVWLRFGLYTGKQHLGPSSRVRAIPGRRHPARRDHIHILWFSLPRDARRTPMD